MSDERHDDERIRGILGRSQSVSVPPFDALHPAPTRSPRRSIAVTLATVIVAVAALYGGRELSTFRQQQASPTAGVAAPSAPASGSPTASPKVVLPQPIPQPVTRTSAAAQVAWVGLYPQGQPSSLIGVDPTGRIVGHLEGGLYWRSADGSMLFRVVDAVVTAYSAADGKALRTYRRSVQDSVLDAALSPNGRWLALIGPSTASLEAIDLQSGLSQVTPLGHDANAQHPGLSGSIGNLTWSTLVFSPDSQRLYTIVDWAGPMSITAFDVTPSGLIQTAGAVDGAGGKTFRGCGGPGIAPRIVDGGKTLVVFCHVDGSVSFIDLATLTTTANVLAEMKNPFWLAPIFTPDGQLLYLHQYPAFGDQMQVVDLRTHALIGPVPTPTKTEEPGPFSWLLGTADAGGTPSTVPISPDGLKVYAAARGAIAVLRVPDLKPLARLAEGYTLNEVWISGDGKTVYATDGGTGVLVLREDGSAPPIVVTMPAQAGGFFASEHG